MYLHLNTVTQQKIIELLRYCVIWTRCLNLVVVPNFKHCDQQHITELLLLCDLDNVPKFSHYINLVTVPKFKHCGPTISYRILSYYVI
jgi:hypothetical protein